MILHAIAELPEPLLQLLLRLWLGSRLRRNKRKKRKKIINRRGGTNKNVNLILSSSKKKIIPEHAVVFQFSLFFFVLLNKI